MITKRAIVLAIILGTASAALVAEKKERSIQPSSDVYINDIYPGWASDTPTFLGQSASRPIIVAQSRCFNGHCY